MEKTTFDEILKTLEEEVKNKSPKHTIISIPKNNGRERIISIPNGFTLDIQKKILEALKKLNLEISDCSMAFKKGTSILDNAKAHLGNKYLIHYDLRDFFDTIFTGRVKEELTKRNVEHKFIKIISKWCFFKGHLPQGAPTSPFLSNLVCANLDKRFSTLAEKIGATYTRYADDIIISGEKNILQYQTIYKRIIRTENFFINHYKTRISVLNPDKGYLYHKITGIAVNKDRVFVRPSYLKEIWKEIRKRLINGLVNHILGEILFVYFIDPEEGTKFYKYFIKNGYKFDNIAIRFVPKIFRQDLR